MKSFLYYLAGLLTGFVVLFGLSFFMDDSSEGITMFAEEGECISTNSFTVTQVVDGGALAAEYMDDLFGLPSGLIVLFSDEEGLNYYDGQNITIPKGKCARQVGIYRYVSAEDVEKTVPVVAIRNK